MTEGAPLLRGKRYIHGEPGSPAPATAAAPAMNRPRPWQLARRYWTAWRTAPLLNCDAGGTPRAGLAGQATGRYPKATTGGMPPTIRQT